MAKKDMMPIWRCKGCNYKTHHMWWEEGIICPVCDQVTGHTESDHGGLTLKQIEKAREDLHAIQREILSQREEQPYFFLSKERR